MLTKQQKIDAIKQVIALCDTCEFNKDYTPISLRESLNMLGFEDVNEIILYVAAKGFHHCVDQIVQTNGNFPPQHACFWGPDQLKSRLQFVL